MSKQNAKLLGGAIAAAVAGVTSHVAGLPSDAAWTVTVTVLCAVYWVTEAIPIPATSLIPFAAFPLLGVLHHKDVAHAYGHHLILLLLGGFILSKAVEGCGAHRRLALGMLHVFGRFGRRGLVLGFMVATAISSMWISNTATVLMSMPIALAILAAAPERDLDVPLLLGIAYAGSIGGIGTPIGTPPNIVFMSVYGDQSGEPPVSFVEWMSWGIPIVCVFVPVAWLILTRRLSSGATPTIPAQGPWSRAERRVVIAFAITAAAWILRSHPAGGWSALLGLGELQNGAWRPSVGDETVALAAVAAMFLLPNGDGGRLLEWERAKEIPWGLLLLFGGGIAIATAFEASGLSAALGDALREVANGPPWLVIGAVCLTVTFVTELTSNTATTWLLMPILCSAASRAGIDPKTLMVPAAISASCAFMMPVATAPNAVVFGTERVPIRQMAAHGVRLNLAGVVIITALCSWLL